MTPGPADRLSPTHPFPAAMPRLALALLLAAAPVTLAAQVTTTPRQVYDELRAGGAAAARKYVGQTVQVRGTADVIERSVFAGYSGIHFHGEFVGEHGISVSVKCHFDEGDKGKLDAVVKGRTVTVVGSEAKQDGPTSLRLLHCRLVDQAATAKPSPEPAAAPSPADPPRGEWAVYQWNGRTFAYQYRFTLAAAGRYRVRDDEWGAWRYDARTKRLAFTTGPLKGFGGLYYTKGRNAEGPTIALNSTGPVTNLEGRENSFFQFAYFRPGGVK